MADDEYDWTGFEQNSKLSCDEIYDESCSYYDNAINIIPRVMFHDEIYVLKEIIAAYTCFHSIAATFAPIMFFSGTSGTGKSNLTILMACMRGLGKSVLGGSSTFASVRNQLNRTRWRYLSTESNALNDYTRNNEKLSILFWADIKASNLSDPKMYGLLRNGTSRHEDKLTIAGEDGKNLEFYVFCPKVISSIEDFYTHASFSELKRRLIVVRTQKLPDSVAASKWLESSINPIDYKWDNVSVRFTEFWDAGRLSRLAHLLKTKAIPKALKKLKWHSDHITAYSDIITQHCVMRKAEPEDTVALWGKYIELQDKWLQTGQLSIDLVVKSIVEPYELRSIDLGLMEVRIDHREINSRLTSLRFSDRKSELTQILQVLGYTHQFLENDLFWVKTL